MPSLPFPRVKMEEAYAVLQDLNHSISREKGDSIQKENALLSKYVGDKWDHEFVFVTDYQRQRGHSIICGRRTCLA